MPTEPTHYLVSAEMMVLVLEGLGDNYGTTARMLRAQMTPMTITPVPCKATDTNLPEDCAWARIEGLGCNGCLGDGTRAAQEDQASTGAERIAAERQRQMDVEGWTPEHDDA